MKCKFCGSDSKVIYKGLIKTGLLSGYTEKEYPVYQCTQCGVIWNEGYKDLKDTYYESGEYRENIDGNSEIASYREKYDGQVLWHLELTGTDIFRDKNVCDIGCGGGSFLDFVNTPAKSIIAIEPNEQFHSGLREQGYSVYAYTSDALKEWKEKINVITSFDAIEHVYEPQSFVEDIYNLLEEGGKCVIGTPTDYPVLREMLGDEFNKFIFQVQHPWVFSEKCLKNMFEKAGFTKVDVVASQKYGLGNLVAWLYERKPRGDIKYPFISPDIDAAYKINMAKNGYAEYLTVYAEK